MKLLITIALAAFLTLVAAPAVLAGGEEDMQQQVPKKCVVSWGEIKNIYHNAATRCK